MATSLKALREALAGSDLAVDGRLQLRFVNARWTEEDLAAAWDLATGRRPRPSSSTLIHDVAIACPATIADAFDQALDLPAHVTTVSLHMPPRALWCAMCVARLPGVQQLTLDVCNSKAHTCASECARIEFVGDAVRWLLRGAPRLVSLELTCCGLRLEPMFAIVSSVEAHAPPSFASASLVYSAVGSSVPAWARRVHQLTTRRGIAWSIDLRQKTGRRATPPGVAVVAGEETADQPVELTGMRRRERDLLTSPDSLVVAAPDLALVMRTAIREGVIEPSVFHAVLAPLLPRVDAPLSLDALFHNDQFKAALVHYQSIQAAGMFLDDSLSPAVRAFCNALMTRTDMSNVPIPTSEHAREEEESGDSRSRSRPQKSQRERKKIN